MMGSVLISGLMRNAYGAFQNTVRWLLKSRFLKLALAVPHWEEVRGLCPQCPKAPALLSCGYWSGLGFCLSVI